MRANCWYGKHDMRVEQVSDPKILNRRDIIVRVTLSAICGSDLHLYDGFIPSMQKGDIIGHEFMGEVVEVGPDVKNLKVGDRVVVRSRSPAATASSATKGCSRFVRTRIRTPGWRRRCGDIRPAASSVTRTCWADLRVGRPSMCVFRSAMSGR